MANSMGHCNHIRLRPCVIACFVALFFFKSLKVLHAGNIVCAHITTLTRYIILHVMLSELVNWLPNASLVLCVDSMIGGGIVWKVFGEFSK